MESESTPLLLTPTALSRNTPELRLHSHVCIQISFGLIFELVYRVRPVVILHTKCAQLWSHKPSAPSYDLAYQVGPVMISHSKWGQLIRWFLTATSGTKPIIVSAGQVYILLHQREKWGSAIQYGYRRRRTHAWEQQEWNKTMRQTKTDRREAWVWKEVKRARIK